MCILESKRSLSAADNDNDNDAGACACDARAFPPYPSDEPERKRMRWADAGAGESAGAPLPTTRMTVAVRGKTMVVAFSSSESRPTIDPTAHVGAFSERAREIQATILRRGVERLVLTGRAFGGALAEIAHLQLRSEASGDPTSPWHPLSQLQQANRLHVHTVAFADQKTTEMAAPREDERIRGTSEDNMQGLLSSSYRVVNLFEGIVRAVADARERSGGAVDRGQLKAFLRRLAQSSAVASDLAFYRRNGKILFMAADDNGGSGGAPSRPLRLPAGPSTVLLSSEGPAFPSPVSSEGSSPRIC